MLTDKEYKKLIQLITDRARPFKNRDQKEFYVPLEYAIGQIMKFYNIKNKVKEVEEIKIDEGDSLVDKVAVIDAKINAAIDNLNIKNKKKKTGEKKNEKTSK